MEERKVKKVARRAVNKPVNEEDLEERKDTKQRKVRFSEEEEIIPSKQKKNEAGKTKRGEHIERINNKGEEDENNEDLDFEDNFDDEWGTRLLLNVIIFTKRMKKTK